MARSTTASDFPSKRFPRLLPEACSRRPISSSVKASLLLLDILARVATDGSIDVFENSVERCSESPRIVRDGALQICGAKWA